MAITGGFGVTIDIDTGNRRHWYMRLDDGVKRWVDNGQPCEPDCDRSACNDYSQGPCDNPDCHALRANAQSKPPAESGSAIADARRIAALPELLGAADNALGVLIASVIPAGGADDKAAILDAQMQLRAAIANVTGNDA